VDRITKTRWWRNREGPPFVHVRDGRGTRFALAYDGSMVLRGEFYPASINLPRWARDPIVVLHELTHLLSPANEAAHGPTYCRNYLAVVKRFLGEEKHRQLKDSFKENGVKWYPKRPQK
jgi:putative metallohydrolase (TIGR04338 family)